MASAALLTPPMLLLAGCGGSPQPGYRDPARLAVGVRRLVEQRLMAEAPRQGSTQSPTHVSRIRCRHASGSRYRCHAVLGGGTELDVLAIVSPDGKRFRLGRPR